MAQREASSEAGTKVGRLRAAWRVLMGRVTTPAQIETEWAEWKIGLQDLLTKLNASLARAAKAELDRARQALDEEDCGCPDEPQPTDREALKAQLRRSMNGQTAAELVATAQRRRTG